MATTIQIFKAGQHTAMSGEQIGFSEADLSATAAAYDPSLHEAPVVVGHPQHDAPAYGWVKGLQHDGDSLSARLDQVAPAFAEAVREGRYKKVSASFYKPDGAGNPKPGAYYLRHVGFLGAQPPAVKGLAPIELGDAGDETVTVEFGEVTGWMLGDLFRSMRNWLIEQFGTEAADSAMPEHLVTSVQEDAGGAAGFAEGTALGNRLRKLRDEKGVTNADLGAAMGIDESTVGQILSGEIKRPPDERLEGAAALLGVAAQSLKDLVADFGEPAAIADHVANPKENDVPDHDKAADLAAREAKLKRDEAAFAERQKQARQAERAAKLDQMVADGRPLPVSKEQIMAFCAHLDGAGAVSFSEGEAAKDPASWLLDDVLGNLPQAVHYGEVAPPDRQSDPDADNTKAIADQAVAYQEEQRQKGLVISVSQAVAHVMNQQKEQG